MDVTCPRCKVDMKSVSEGAFRCPTCAGEFFSSLYFEQKRDAAYVALWEWCMRRYSKALRDTRQSDAVARRAWKIAGISL